jgi:hypothetical protein
MEQAMSGLDVLRKGANKGPSTGGTWFPSGVINVQQRVSDGLTYATAEFRKNCEEVMDRTVAPSAKAE